MYKEDDYVFGIKKYRTIERSVIGILKASYCKRREKPIEHKSNNSPAHFPMPGKTRTTYKIILYYFLKYNSQYAILKPNSHCTSRHKLHNTFLKYIWVNLSIMYFLVFSFLPFCFFQTGQAFPVFF